MRRAAGSSNPVWRERARPRFAWDLSTSAEARARFVLWGFAPCSFRSPPEALRLRRQVLRTERQCLVARRDLPNEELNEAAEERVAGADSRASGRTRHPSPHLFDHLGRHRIHVDRDAEKISFAGREQPPPDDG